MTVASDLLVKGCYLNGRFIEPANLVDVINPATGKIFARMGTIDRATLRTALDDAQKSFPGWRKTAAKARGACLRKIADILERRKDEFARVMTQENGKPLAQSQGELAMTIDHLQWFAEEARRVYGRVVPPQQEGKRHLVLKSPVGVVGAIGPWNFPLVLGIRKVAPALAAGCPVILKPAAATPICNALFAEAVHEAGLPPGVFQMVVGPAREIGDELLSNPICRKITFTGSTAVGKQLIRGAAEGVKKLSLELGGCAPAIVFEDADLDKAVEGILIAKYRNTGQSCIAANRVYVQRSIYAKFNEAIAKRVSAMKCGDGLEPGVEIGPVINQAGLDSALEQIRQATALGAKVLCGGERQGTTGYFLQPTVLIDVPDGALCMKEETFAPMAPIAPFDTEAEVIAKANASEYGLAAYVFTQNVARGLRVIEQLEAGTIGWNDGVPTTSQCPFGGFKQSGWGRELGTEGLESFLETKHVAIGGVD